MKSSSNPHRGTIWIFSDKLKQNKKVDKSSPIPDGWKQGRVLNWESYLNKPKEKARKERIRKEREHKLEKRMAQTKREYTEMYKVYC